MPPRTTSTPMPGCLRCTVPAAATRGSPLDGHLLAQQSISASLRSAPLVRYSSLRPALHTDEAAEEPLHAREKICRATQQSDWARVRRSPAIRGLCGLL